MKALIKVEIRTIGDRPIQSVSARELHAFLESSTRFNDGIARRIAEYRFEEGKDFYSFLSKTSQDEAQGGFSLKWAEDVLVLMTPIQENAA
ncbi:antA/AntB antirepressor family protein [Candidatus Glomeribacter gigasporarum]|uniref:antA/AntB antirepressor family protein n=1 Tax=Candidatus Glomeribacter gigasporarum TaxID=132144 RepID=UPI0002F0AEED|nr:antA/AntB antirepressor family protein [Candidatus Glomeribacter gigasporarum]